MGWFSLEEVILAEHFKYAQVKLDASSCYQQLRNADVTIRQLVRSEKILTKMAASVIVSSEPLIPEKLNYKLKKSKGPIKRDAKTGKPVLYKSGKKKGMPKRETFSPAQYYYYRNLTEAERERYEPISKSDTVLHKQTSQRKVVTHKRKRYRGVLLGFQLLSVDKGKKYTKTYATGTGDVHTGYRKITDSRKKKRVHWVETQGYALYNKEYIKDESYSKNGRKNVAYYSDRPPHLNDIDDTHKIKFVRGVAQIIITNKKPRDTRYVEEGGKQYGAKQYYGPDKGWKRTTENTTSRWLEVAIGLPVPDNISMPSIPTAEANYERMINIMLKEIERINKKR